MAGKQHPKSAPAATFAAAPGKGSALGRGLSALLPGAPSPAASPRGFLTVPLAEVTPEREQPRRYWDTARIEELAASIRTRGVIQPILVRRVKEGGYRIVAGERRWRAAQVAGLIEIPVIVKEVTETEAFELALVENIQREDLNPIEEAEAYQRLLSEHGLKQEDLATRVGKERSTIANALRLLKLPANVREHVASGTLSVGHAKVLLGIDQAEALASLALQVTSRALSVRETERLVQRWKAPPEPRSRETAPAELRALARRLERALGMPCEIEMKSAEAGTLSIRFSSLAQAGELLESLAAEIDPQPRVEKKAGP